MIETGAAFTLLVAQYEGRSIPSKVIQWQTWSPISHSSLVRVPLGFSDMLYFEQTEALASAPVIEAWRGKVRLHQGLADGHKPGTLLRLYSIAAPLDAAVAWDFALGQVGKPYDRRGVMGFASRRHRAQSDHRWFCSELVFASLQAGGCNLLARINAYQVSPAKIDISTLLDFVLITET